MRRMAGLVLILAAVLPVVFAYAASFEVSYSGSTVIVVPVEDVVTEREGGPASATSVAPSTLVSLDSVQVDGTAAAQPTPFRTTTAPSVPATPTPRQLPKVPQVPGFSRAVR